MPALTILIPAAGASSRMRGADKLLLPVAGQPLLRRQALAALATGHPVIVTLRPTDTARRVALTGLPLTLLEIPDAATGLAASLRAAATCVTTALMILPADMPDLDSLDLEQVIAAFARAPTRIHRGASVQGQPGHPVILPVTLVPGLTTLAGDVGARGLVEIHGAIAVPLPGQHALTDLDTPEDWAAWHGA